MYSVLGSILSFPARVSIYFFFFFFYEFCVVNTDWKSRRCVRFLLNRVHFFSLPLLLFALFWFRIMVRTLGSAGSILESNFRSAGWFVEIIMFFPYSTNASIFTDSGCLPNCYEKLHGSILLVNVLID